MTTSVGIRVVLVDDNALFREGLARILNRDGRFTVVGQASDGLEGAELAKSLLPDLVLLDLRMPVMDGAQAAAAIRGRHPAMRIGILTVLESDRQIRPALEAGADGYLAKDASAADFCDAAVQLHAGNGNRLPRGEAPPATPASRASGPLAGLTAREIEVLRALGGSETNQAIARSLGVSPKTLSNHISNLYRKLHIYDRAQAVIVAVNAGLIEFE